MANRSPFTRLGQCGAILEVVNDARCVAAAPCNVLLTGESGVGKGFLAECIHQRSPRRRRRMLSRNCAGVSSSPRETELFESARGTTLLLVDVGAMGPRMQTRLLDVIENGDDVRIISATRGDLLQRTAEQGFCVDLYYRLNVVHLQIPALRERPEDIAFLMGYYLRLSSEDFRQPLCELHPSAVARLEAYSWRGNIRELREVAQLLALTHAGRVVSVDQLPEAIRGGRDPVEPIAAMRVDSAIADQVARACYDQITQGPESFWTVVYGPFAAGEITRDTVRAVITRGLRHTNGNYQALTTLFNMPRTDQPRLLTFLHQHGGHPRPRALRAATGDPVRVPPASQRKAV